MPPFQILIIKNKYLWNIKYSLKYRGFIHQSERNSDSLTDYIRIKKLKFLKGAEKNVLKKDVITKCV